MPDDTALVPEHYVPDEYEGDIAPNARCRAWDPPDGAYCEAGAGEGTDHEGTGRCARHEGTAVATRPRPRDRYGKLRSLDDAYHRYSAEAAGDPLDVGPELALLRATLEDSLARYEDNVEAVDAFQDWWRDNRDGDPPTFDIPHPRDAHQIIKSIVGIAHKERKLREAGSISHQEWAAKVFAMGRSVRDHVMDPALADDEAVLRAIEADWKELGVV